MQKPCQGNPVIEAGIHVNNFAEYLENLVLQTFARACQLLQQLNP
jgi:hypothetical protein